MASKQYKDSIPPSTGRSYLITTNQDGTSKIEDVTEYVQEGTPFGTADVNESCIIEAEYSVEKDPTDTSNRRQIHKLVTPNTTARNLKFEVAFPDQFNVGDIFTLNGEQIDAKLFDGNALPQDYFSTDNERRINVVSCFKGSDGALYFTPNPVISDGTSQYTFGVDGIKNLPTFTDETTGQTKIIEGHEDYTFVVTNGEEVSIVGSDLAISKVGPMMFFGGLISVKYTGAQKTLLQLAKADGTVDGINVCHGGNNAIFFASLNDKKIARLSWVKSADGQSVSLVLSWIFDLATGQPASNATYTIAIDSQYFAGY